MDRAYTYKILGCVYEVYNELGPGLLESIYEKAMIKELGSKGFEVKNQVQVPVYYKGELISSHERINGRDQASYHLDDYLPLLEKRPRALFDAAPVKQNVPYEVLQMLKDNSAPKDKIISILKYYANGSETIKDPVMVKEVDLRQYDALSIGKEG